MEPLPEKDEFKVFEIHIRVLGVFWVFLVFGKLIFPFLLGERGANTGDWLPINNREAGLSEAGDAADADDGEDDAGADEEPTRNGTGFFGDIVEATLLIGRRCSSSSGT